MREHFFVRSHVIARLRRGPLGPYLDDLATMLHRQGYAPSSIQSYLRTGDTFGRWLHRHGYTVSELDAAVVQRYVTGLMRYRSGHLPKAAEGLNHLLRFLQHQGVMRLWSAASSITPVDLWLAEYATYLDQAMGLAVGTQQGYLRMARRFLIACFGPAVPDWSALTAPMITTFVCQEAAQVAKQNQYLTDHPRANAQGAWHKLVARAKHLRLADWVELTLEERSITLTVKEDAQQEAAKLDGCYVLKTDLTPAQAHKELVHDRYKDLASVEQAFRSCKTAHLGVRPIFLRLAERTRAHAFVVMLAYQIIQYLASCWSTFDLTVEEGLHALTTLCLVEVSPHNAPSYHCIPTPRDAIARLLHSADLKLPKVFALSGTRVSTRKKLPSERLVP